MEVQIFGTRKCRDTQKAQRFFKERRIKIHMVDLDERPASPGELRRFMQKFGVEALLDRESPRFRNRGLHAASLTESRIEKLLEEDSLLLKTPLVRSGNKLSIGNAPEVWNEMVARVVTEPAEILVRLARETEAESFLQMVDALAAFEKLEGPSAEGRERLRRDGFAEPRRFQTWLAIIHDTPVGYAVTFQTYSTFRALPNLYLEDLFVMPEAREKGVATAIMRFLAEEALRQGCDAMQWAVLDWNERAIDFYNGLGATRVSEWYAYRLDNPQLVRIAEQR